MKDETLVDAEGYEFTIGQKSTASSLVITVTPAGSTFGGSWALSRRLSDGRPESIRIYPVRDSSIWITLRPDGADPETGRALLDFTIRGKLACRNVTVGIPFIRLYTTPLATIVSLTKNAVPWRLLSPDPHAYYDVAAAVPLVRAGLPSLVSIDDACFNEDAEPVYISDGQLQDPSTVIAKAAAGKNRDAIIGGVSDAGFVKWIVDGIIRPRTGSGLKIAALKGEETEDGAPPFHLAWTRNLASAVVSMESGRTLKPDSSGVDVKIDRLAGASPYSLNIGYRVADLEAMLYYLAVTEPGNLYLGAVSALEPDGVTRTFRQCAAFFPWFDETGEFTVSVFESAREEPLDDFVASNRAGWVNLVRVRVPSQGYFEP
jgi:hypothetical protein